MRLCIVVGARPQFIKLWPLATTLEQLGVDHWVVHTGQHYDPNMSDVFFAELGMARPDVELNFGGLTPAEGTGRMIVALGDHLTAEKPDMVIVFGDTNSTLAAAVAASKTETRLAHIEAGLRSFDRRMPEETNRVLTDHVSDLLFCPTQTAVSHLASEGIVAGVHEVGDIMFDAAIMAQQMSSPDHELEEITGGDSFALATIHRAESTSSSEALAAILDYVAAVTEPMPVVLPLHPRTAKALEVFDLALPTNVRIVEPLSYLRMARATNEASLVLTDSGGLQKEAYFHRTPCVTLRSTTEWTETIEHGWNRLWTDSEYRPRSDFDDYGHGDTAERILDIILGS